MLQVITAIIRPFPFFFFFKFRQDNAILQRSKIHANKIKGCLGCHHLWSVENLKAIYFTGDTCIAGIKMLVTSCFPEMVVATHAYRQ